jgi:type IV secretion system protein VirB1
MNAIISVESGGNPLAIGDNTTHRAYTPRDINQAKAIARALLAKHHSLDLGIAQINNVNYASYHVTADQLFDPCTNLKISADILSRDYQTAVQVAPTPQAALWGAISAYNTGSLYAGAPYVSAVVNAAEHAHVVPTISLLTGASPAPAVSASPANFPAAVTLVKPAPLRPKARVATARQRHTDAANAPLIVGHSDGIPHTLETSEHSNF